MTPMPAGLKDHALRRELTSEVHARPFMLLQPPERATHLALITDEHAADADRARVAVLCERFGAEQPADDASYHMAEFPEFRLRWERHTEFSTYTFLAAEPVPAARFSSPVIERVPKDWRDTLPGKVLVAVHVEVEPQDSAELDPEELPRILGTDNFAGAQVSGGAANAFMNFSMLDDGYGRLLLRHRRLKPRQAGRLLQRLLEIETYRMMALLALPLARQYSGALSAAESRLTAVTNRMTELKELEDERALLGELTELSSEVERVQAATAYRFGAARAYFELVGRRIEELREERIEGYQTFQEFFGRRLTPAMRTCEAVGIRIADLSRRVTRVGQLLRTRVDVQLEAQNRDLLESMDRRVKLQTRLQETVEGFSVVAISYYLVSLIGYAAKSLKSSGLSLDPAVVMGISIPVVALLVWFGVRRLRKLATRSVEKREN